MGQNTRHYKWLSFILISLGLFMVGLVLYRSGFLRGSSFNLGVKRLFLLGLGVVSLLGGVVTGNPRARQSAAGYLAPYFSFEQESTMNRFERVSRLFLAAGCLGLFSGILEAGAYWFLSLVPDRFGWKNDLLPQILWIAPVFNLLLFWAATLPLALLQVRPRRKLVDPLTFAFLGLFAFFGPLAALGKFNSYALFFLTAGLTFQFLRMAASRHYFSRISLQKSFTLLLGFTLFLNAAYQLTSPANQAHAVAAQPPQAQTPPNVLFIIIDTLRADHLSSYGYGRNTTPNIDRLASQGVLFENAYSPASWTLPSHASIFTGRTPGEHGAGVKPLGVGFPTLAGSLSEQGYQTGGFSANLYFVIPRTGLTRGFGHFEGYFSNALDMASRTYYGKEIFKLFPAFGYFDIVGRKSSETVNQELLGWLDQASNKPFFAFINYFDVHDPYLPPDPYLTEFTDHPTNGERINSELYPRDFTGGKTLTAAQIQNEMDGYDASISYVDAGIGSLIKSLSERGLLDNTLLVIASDHGEAFGEHGLLGHGQNTYRELVHVPLIFRLPGNLPAGARVAAPVSLLDLPVTILDVLGLSNHAGFPGQSLASCWSASGTVCGTKPVLVESLPGIVPEPDLPLGRRSGMISFLTSDWQMIYNEDGQIELYQFNQDPKEALNLADTPQGKAALRQICAQTAGLVKDQTWKEFGIPAELQAKCAAKN